jgi:4'-phosphopantetheinyl transferase EntD
MNAEEEELEQTIATALDAPVRVAVARAAKGDDDDHALGKTALARALVAAGRADHAITAWPCPFASVSHSKGVAIAVALPRHRRARGLGVDLEIDRPMKAGMALIFCNDRERAWLADLPVDERPAAMLQLWTAKEALYKADPAQGDAIVAEYGVDVPTLARGGRGAARSTRLVSLRTGAALLSVALDPEEEDEHVEATW